MSMRAGWQQVALLIGRASALGTTEENRRASETKSLPLILCETKTTPGSALGCHTNTSLEADGNEVFSYLPL